MPFFGGFAGYNRPWQQMPDHGPLPGERDPFNSRRRGGVFSPGGVGTAFLGGLADAMSQAGGLGTPFAQAADFRRQMEYEEAQHQRRRQEDLEDLRAQLGIKAEFEKPDTPGVADEASWYWSLSPEERSKADQYLRIRYPGNYTPPTPIRMEAGDVIEGGGGQATTQEQYNALPPGAEYTAPDGTRRRKGGASPSNGSGGFPGPY